VEACLAGHEATGDTKHLRHAQSALEWFVGRNLQGRSLYDPETSGCFDALMEGGVNRNRGAESTVAFLMARLTMLEARQRMADTEPAGEEGDVSVPRMGGTLAGRPGAVTRPRER
jgi:hypothetical protein